MSKEITVKVMLGNYKYIEIPLEDSEEFLRMLSKRFPSKNKDIKEVLRIIRNFDVFYDIARKKFKNYILIPHDSSDMLKGTILFDKVKLLIGENGRKKVGLIFDRSISLENVMKVLEELGYSVNIVKSEL